MRPEVDWTLYLVTDREFCGTKQLEDLVRSAVRGGVTAVQLREKSCSTREFVDLGRRLKSLLKEVPLLINDRADVAAACGADGVHIGQSDLEYPDARRILGDDAIIGLSVENEDQAMRAEAWDVDYLGVSPVFETSTKTDTSTAWGIERLMRLRMRSRHKLIAIGGIHTGNTAQIIRAGADGVAVVSSICGSGDPEIAARSLRMEIETARNNESSHNRGAIAP